MPFSLDAAASHLLTSFLSLSRPLPPGSLPFSSLHFALDPGVPLRGLDVLVAGVGRGQQERCRDTLWFGHKLARQQCQAFSATGTPSGASGTCGRGGWEPPGRGGPTAELIINNYSSDCLLTRVARLAFCIPSSFDPDGWEVGIISISQMRERGGSGLRVRSLFQVTLPAQGSPRVGSPCCAAAYSKGRCASVGAFQTVVQGVDEESGARWQSRMAQPSDLYRNTDLTSIQE